jgi:hypothetical protein
MLSAREKIKDPLSDDRKYQFEILGKSYKGMETKSFTALEGLVQSDVSFIENASLIKNILNPNLTNFKTSKPVPAFEKKRNS